MLKKEIFRLLWPGLIFFLLVCLIHWQLKFSLLLFALGLILGLLGMFLDGLIYAYFQAPHELTPQRVKRCFQQKMFEEGFLLLIQTENERRRVVLHSVLFQLVLVIVSFFVLTSSNNLLGKGLVLGLYLHTLVDQGLVLVRGNLDDWFWQFKNKPSRDTQIYYFFVLLVVFLIFALFLV